MTTTLLIDRDTPDVELTFDNLNKAKGHARAQDIHRWVAKDTAGITLASWLDPTGKDHENIAPARTDHGSPKARPCTTGRLRVTLRVPDASDTKAHLAHQKLATEYVKLGAAITYHGSAGGWEPIARPCTPVTDTCHTAPADRSVTDLIRDARKARPTATPASPTGWDAPSPPKVKPAAGSKRRANELHGDFAKRRAAETGRPWYLSRPAFSSSPRVADRAPEGRGWTAYLPAGRTFSSAYGRTSNAGKKVLSEIATLVAAWKREQAAAALGSPVTVDGTPSDPAIRAMTTFGPRPTPLGPVYGPTRDDMPAAAQCEACGSPIRVAVDVRHGVLLCERCRTDAAASFRAASWAAPTSAPVYAIDVPMLPTGGASESDVTALPRPMTDYLARLLCATKREYAKGLALHLIGAAPAPATPDTDWADDVSRKVNRYITTKEIANV